VSLKIDVDKSIETADQAEELLFQARLQNKRVVVVQTDSGRAIRITQPNNILTQFFKDISGQTQREQSQMTEFVSSLRAREAKLVSRASQVLPSAAVASNTSLAGATVVESRLDIKLVEQPQDPKNTESLEEDELEVVEETAAHGEAVIPGFSHAGQEKTEKITPKVKTEHQNELLQLPDQNSRKFNGKAKAEERRALVRAVNREYAEVEQQLVELAAARNAADDQAYEVKEKRLHNSDLKNHELAEQLRAVRENQEKI
jgi:hypothetical protein